jgi:hypothetical protein
MHPNASRSRRELTARDFVIGAWGGAEGIEVSIENGVGLAKGAKGNAVSYFATFTYLARHLD